MNITIAQWEDWIAIYLDGELKYEGHSIDGGGMLRTLGIPYEFLSVEGEDAWELCGIKSLDTLKEELKTL